MTCSEINFGSLIDRSRVLVSLCIGISSAPDRRFHIFNNPGKMKSSKYRPEIDGLRAIAVLGVLLFHANLGVPGGYVGVDVFFVISGYLITGIILRAQEKNSFSLLEFWERRIRRIFPALTAMLLATLAVGCYILLPDDLEEFGQSAIAQTLFVANIFFWRDTGYFAGPAELKPLLHTWSLAVEEQFYFFLPVLLIVLKNQSRQRVFNILLLGTIVSFVISAYGAFNHSGATFFLLPTRAWELSFGCLLAAAPWKAKSRPKRDRLMAVSGLLGILGSMFLFDSKTPFPGLAALPSVAGTTAVIYATNSTRNCAVGRLLSIKPLVFVGLISYSLYLWHWPVIVYLKYATEEITTANLSLALIVIALLAVLSWRFIERPFRERTFLGSTKAVLLSSCGVSFVLISLASFLIYSEGLKNRFPEYASALLEDTRWIGSEYGLPTDDLVRRDVLPVLGLTERDASGQLDFVLWGDSHGLVMSYIFDDVANELGLRGVAIARHGRSPLPNVWKVADTTTWEIEKELKVGESILSFLAKERPRNLFLVSRWSSKCEGMTSVEIAANPNADSSASMVVDAEVVEVTPESSSKAITRQLANLVRKCEKLGIAVWIVKQVPESAEPQPAKDLLRWQIGWSSTLRDEQVSVSYHNLRQRWPRLIFNSLVSEELKVRFLDPAPYFFDHKGRHQTYFGGRSLYRDDDHLTRWGAERMRPLILNALTSIRPQPAADPVLKGK